MNYWRNHGKAAIHEIPSTATSYFTAHTRLGRGSEVANGVKRQRRSSSDFVKSKEELRDQDNATAEVKGKDFRSREPSESPEVTSSSRRDLRKEGAATATANAHTGTQQGATDSTRMDSAVGARCPRGTEHESVSEVAKPAGCRKRERALDSRRNQLANEQRGFSCTKEIATKCMGRLRREL